MAFVSVEAGGGGEVAAPPTEVFSPADAATEADVSFSLTTGAAVEVGWGALAVDCFGLSS